MRAFYSWRKTSIYLLVYGKLVNQFFYSASNTAIAEVLQHESSINFRNYPSKNHMQPLAISNNVISESLIST